MNEMIALIPDEYARLNVTFNGYNGDLGDPVRYDLDTNTIRRMAQEAVRSGDIAGIPASPDASLDGFEVERFDAKDNLPNRVLVRPKTTFGG